jgi:hypothetical protein
MPAIVNRQLGLPLAPQHLAGHPEPLAEVAAVQRIAQRITVLAANESVVVGRPLVTAKPLPLDQISKGAGVPCERHLAGLVPLPDLAANPNRRPAVVNLHVGEYQSGDLGGPQSTAGGQAEHDQVCSGVHRSTRLAAKFGQNQSHFVRLENLGTVNSPGAHHLLLGANLASLLDLDSDAARSPTNSTAFRSFCSQICKTDGFQG